MTVLHREVGESSLMTDYEKFKCKVHHLDFMRYMWRKKGDSLKVGLHTKAICDRIDRAVNDFDDGISTYLIIAVPFRHGKSDIISRYEPAHFIGTHPDCDVMIATYSSSLAEGFSRFARNLVKTSDFYDVFKKELSDEKAAVNEWGLKWHNGTVTASGMSSGITGKGYHLGILDDYCANREQAESDVMREKAWNSFTNDFFTRQAPVSITIILATPWHVDDIIGRIRRKNDEDGEDYDPDFEKFEVITFPAMNGSASVTNCNGEEETVDYDYLFTPKELSTGEKIDGRFTPRWYQRQAAALGEYGTASLLQCSPQIRGGNLINTGKITVHNSESEFPNTKYFRVWDMAHSERQRVKSDPDWTSGTLLAFRNISRDNVPLWELWIKDVARIKADAPERDNFIRAVAEKDGRGVTVAVEQSIDSKDAYKALCAIMNGRILVRKVVTDGDKVARMSYVEPIFEAGNVHILRGAWNLDWLNEVKEFPSGKHDDQVDNMSAGYVLCCQNDAGQIKSGRVAGV